MTIAGTGKGPTRRQAIAGAIIMSAGVAMRPARIRAEGEEISHTAESIHQETQYSASRERVFDALMSTKQFDRIIHIASGRDITSLGTEPTAISRDVGGAFTIFGGHILGRNIELVVNLADRAGVAGGGLGSGPLFHRQIRTGRAGRRDKDHLRPYRLPPGPGATPCGRLEVTLLAATGEVPG